MRPALPDTQLARWPLLLIRPTRQGRFRVVPCSSVALIRVFPCSSVALIRVFPCSSVALIRCFSVALKERAVASGSSDGPGYLARAMWRRSLAWIGPRPADNPAGNTNDGKYAKAHVFILRLRASEVKFIMF
jgi:hypothetical protein